MSQSLEVGLNAVVFAVTEETPRVLTVPREDVFAEARAGAPSPLVDALPFGPLDPEGDRTLELGLRRWVREQTGFELGYAEQLYTFGDRHRDPRESRGAERTISIGYLALMREGAMTRSGKAHWRDCYAFLPWEDWREGRPSLIDRWMVPALEAWARGVGAPESRLRRERVEISFGLGGVSWDGERVLDRFELLYEAGLVGEAQRDRRLAAATSGTKTTDATASTGSSSSLPARFGADAPLALDHRRMLATALGRLRGKLRYRPVVFELVPPTFTLLQLQRTVEALAGVRLHKQNFRRLVETGGLVEGTGRLDDKTGGRPAEIFRFRRDVLRERPTPGVGLPGARHQGPAG